MKEPKIRFQGFTGEWEESAIGEISSSFSGGTPSVSVAKYYGGEIPFIRSGEINENKTQLFLTEEGLNSSSAKLIEKGTLLYALYGATSGEVGISKISGAINQAILAIYPKNGHSPEYMSHYLKSKKNDIIRVLLQGGQGNLSGALVKNITISLPTNLNEEYLLAKCINTLDSLIQSTNKKIESLKQVKAASLQSMFPQEGETTPRVRFKGFEGEWDVVTIDSICKKSVSKHSENSLGENVGQYPIYGASGYIQNIETYDFDVPYVGVIKDGSGVGRSQLYPAYSSILGTMQYILPKGDMDVTFLAYLFETINFSSYVNGSSIPHIYFKDYSIKNVKVPSINEQRVIGEYFQNLDSQIALLSQQLEKLQQIKSACLDKMFV